MCRLAGWPRRVASDVVRAVRASAQRSRRAEATAPCSRLRSVRVWLAHTGLYLFAFLALVVGIAIGLAGWAAFVLVCATFVGLRRLDDSTDKDDVVVESPTVLIYVITAHLGGAQRSPYTMRA